MVGVFCVAGWVGGVGGVGWVGGVGAEAVVDRGVAGDVFGYWGGEEFGLGGGEGGGGYFGVLPGAAVDVDYPEPGIVIF